MILEVAADAGPLHTEVYRDSLKMDAGRVLPPTAPGLGVTLSDDVRKRFSFIPGSGEFVSVPGKQLNDEALLHAASAG
jgi:hypothetical protein